MIDPTREEWLVARERLSNVPEAGISDPTTDAITEAVLGPCPPEPEPAVWRPAGGAIGSLVVTTHADGGVWVGFPQVKHQMLTADEADEAAAALIEHARYAREQGDPWRSDEEAAALIDAIKEPCGRMLVGQGTDTWDPVCQRPKGHSMPCASEDDE